MKKFILVPDSFKGTLSSTQICGIMREEIAAVFPDAEICAVPVADGGEGSVEAFLAAVGGEKKQVAVKGPYGEDITGFYGKLSDTLAVVEMAAAAGLPLVGENLHAEKTTTYGVGQLIEAAAKDGAKKIIVGLGGSATHDGGAGCAAALGVRFFDEKSERFVPVGETLKDIRRIDLSGRAACLDGVTLVTMCDIDNPLCGQSGAAAVFGPQKGADEPMVRLLDEGLRHFAEILKRDTGVDILNLPGAGAAGGMGGGMVGLLGASLQMGIDTVLDTVGFDTLVQGASLVLTGEGRIDGQSLRGKVVIGVAKRCQKQNVPVVAVVGDIADGAEAAYGAGVSAIFSINRRPMPFSESRFLSEHNMRLTMRNLIRLVSSVGAAGIRRV